MLADAVAWAVRTVYGSLDGAPEVLNRNPWGAVTAAVRIGRRALVLKASDSPEVRHSGRMAELLARAAPGLVPRLVAWEGAGERVYTLLERSRGGRSSRSIGSSRRWRWRGAWRGCRARSRHYPKASWPGCRGTATLGAKGRASRKPLRSTSPVRYPPNVIDRLSRR